MTNLLLGLALAGFTFVVAQRAGWPSALAVSSLASLGGLSVVLLSASQPSPHYGIATGAPEFTTLNLLLLLAAAAIWLTGGRLNIWPVLITFVALAAILTATEWGNTVQQQSGMVLLLFALLAFGVGSWLGANKNLAAQAGLVTVAAGLCAIQAVTALAQSQGILILLTSDPAARFFIEEQNRMVGLYNHPSTLGKTAFLLLAILLPMTTSTSRYCRLVSMVGIISGLVGTVLTLARANTLAIIIALVLWMVINRRTISLGRRLSTLVALGVALLANTSSVSGLVSRNEEDPLGGQRPELLRVGLDQIASAPWTGIGPNSYSETVGRFNELAATGFPVHNTFLLGVAELGIPLAVIFFSPIAITLLSCLRRRHRIGHLDARGATFISMVPGMAIIAWTGWGMLALATLPLWYFALGYLRAEDPVDVPDQPVDHRLRSRADVPTVGAPNRTRLQT